MLYKNFKDISLSRLGMGNMRLPVDSSKEGSPVDYDKAQEMIDYAMSQGINYYDTAYVYHNGESETFLGHAMNKYPRESYYLATKFNIHANSDYKATFEEQLEKLQTDYIDFYLLHAVMDHTYEQYIDCGCIDYFVEQQKKGRIKYLGFSSHSSPEVLEKMASYRKWDFVQIQLNYYDWMYGSAKKEYEILTEKNIPVMVMESIRGGRLSSLTDSANELLKKAEPERSISSWALRFLMSLPNVQVMLSGMSTLEQAQDNIGTFSHDCALSEEETQLLLKACDLFHGDVVVPCTGCRYCCEGCPQQIDIPSVLAIYNKLKTDGTWGIRETIDKIEAGKGPGDCIGCGACLTECPQSIQIPDMMAELAAVK